MLCFEFWLTGKLLVCLYVQFFEVLIDGWLFYDAVWSVEVMERWMKQERWLYKV
jgi:hypothetical protein